MQITKKELEQIKKELRREHALKGAKAHWKGTTKAQRKEMTAKARKALARMHKMKKKLSTGE